MTTQSINSIDPNQGYPGGYVPNPLIFDTIREKHCGTDASGNQTNFKILENKKYYKIELVAPGFKRENFLVHVNEKCDLSISAMHTDAERKEKLRYEQQELNNDCLDLKIALPQNIDTDFTSAQYKSGILSIWFLKIEKSYRHRASMIIVY